MAERPGAVGRPRPPLTPLLRCDDAVAVAQAAAQESLDVGRRSAVTRTKADSARP